MCFKMLLGMQESVNQDRPEKLFADVKEVEIT